MLLMKGKWRISWGDTLRGGGRRFQGGNASLGCISGRLTQHSTLWREWHTGVLTVTRQDWGSAPVLLFAPLKDRSFATKRKSEAISRLTLDDQNLSWCCIGKNIWAHKLDLLWELCCLKLLFSSPPWKYYGTENVNRNRMSTFEGWRDTTFNSFLSLLCRVGAFEKCSADKLVPASDVMGGRFVSFCFDS